MAMTDEQMDTRLRRAGEAWRAAGVPVAEAPAESQVASLVISSTGRPRRARRAGLLASAAVVVAALVAGGALLIANIGSGGNRHTQPPAGARTVGLVGTSWTLAAITDANGNAVPVAGGAALAFAPDNRFKGSDGCYGIGGKAQVGRSTIDFRNRILGTTPVTCRDPQVNATADHVDAVLSGKVTWAIDSERLTLTKAGAGTLVYRANTPPATKKSKLRDPSPKSKTGGVAPPSANAKKRGPASR
jgi:heat shock protein HslJ